MRKFEIRDSIKLERKYKRRGLVYGICVGAIVSAIGIFGGVLYSRLDNKLDEMIVNFHGCWRRYSECLSRSFDYRRNALEYLDYTAKCEESLDLECRSLMNLFSRDFEDPINMLAGRFRDCKKVVGDCIH